MSELPAVGLGGKSPFSEWQPIYAERGIALIPCGDNKVPLVKNPQKFGREASREIANKFGDASAFGYYCGKRNGITVLDVDTPDERVLSDALNRHGQTPIIVKTGSGKFHALYRHNKERRSIKPWGFDLKIDLLGNGLAIAPPSIVPRGRYQIIEGQLDDLDRLPIMCGLEERLYSEAGVGPRPQIPLQAMREGDGRNPRLWQMLMREARHWDDYQRLLDRAAALNATFGEPMEANEVTKITKSAWEITARNENLYGRGGSILVKDDIDRLVSEPYTLTLLNWLKAHHSRENEFWIADGLGDVLGCSRRRLPEARRSLLELGYIEQIKGGNRFTGAALFRWSLSSKRGARASSKV